MTIHTRYESAEKTVVEDWGTLTWLASQALTGSDVTVGRVTIRPGTANPRHCHDNCEEVLYLLHGSLKHSLGDQIVQLQAGDTLCVAAGVMHNAVNTGDVEADMIVTYSSGVRLFRKEETPDR